MNQRSIFLVRILMVLFAALLAGLFLSQTASAQSAATQNTSDGVAAAIAAPSPNDVRELMRLLDDPAIRNWLAEAAKTDLGKGAAAVPAISLRESLHGLVASSSDRLKELSDLWVDIREAPYLVLGAWQSQVSDTQSLQIIIYAVIFLFIGAAFEWLYYQYTKTRLLRIEFADPDTLRGRANTVLARSLYHLGGMLCFSVGSVGAFLIFDWPETVQNLVLDFLVAVLLGRLVFTISKNLFAPRVKNLRLVPLSNLQAKSVHRWIVAFGFTWLITDFFNDIFRQLKPLENIGEAQSVILSVSIIGDILLSVVALAAIWHLRGKFMKQDPTDASRRKRLGNPWPVILSILVLLFLVLVTLNAEALADSLLIFGLLVSAVKLAGKWIDNLYDQAEGIDVLHGTPRVLSEPENRINIEQDISEVEGSTEPEALDESIDVADGMGDDYDIYTIHRSVSKRAARFFLVALTILGLVWIWGIDLFELSASKSVGGLAFDVFIDAIFAILLADLVWHWAKLLIDRRLAGYVPPPDGQAPGPEARMATLLPMLRTILMVVLLSVVILSVLTSLGVNIGPLLAGAGVLGVAIGFGAQSLVRDVVSGIFFLIDDAFRIGEYIEIDDLRGTVESMSIRSLRVRHHRGMVHTIPFGELKSLTNYSRDWVIMKLEFRVPFDTDLKLVKKIVKKIGAELLENETYGKSILQTLKSQGVRRMEEFNMVVGVKFMAKPGEQWLIRRDAYQKVRDAFEANGIGFAERNVKVEVLSDQPLDEEGRKAVVGAAQNAIEQQLPPVPVKDEP